MTDEQVSERSQSLNVTDVWVTDLPETVGPPPSDMMLTSVQERGVIVPVLIGYGDQRELVVIDGNRRIAACRRLGISQVPALFVELHHDSEHAELTLLANQMRSDNMFAEVAAYMQLRDAGFNDQQIGAMAGMGKAELGRRQRIVEANRVLLNGYLHGGISQTTMDAIVKLDRYAQDALAFRYRGQMKLTMTDVNQVRRDLQPEPERKVIDHTPAEMYEMKLLEAEEAAKSLYALAPSLGVSIDQVRDNLIGISKRLADEATLTPSAPVQPVSGDPDDVPF